LIFRYNCTCMGEGYTVYEFLEVIIPLGKAGYDLVIPSIPGFGFSSRPTQPFGHRQVAQLWRRLMLDVLG